MPVAGFHERRPALGGDHQAGGDLRRDVRDDGERLFRKLHLQGIFMDHVDVAHIRETFSEAQGQVRVVFHCQHSPCHPRELAGEHSSSGPELDN
jgi:hypothetical protein